MSDEVRRIWHEVDVEREAACSKRMEQSQTVDELAANAYADGEEWVMHFVRKHGLDIDDIAAVVQEVHGTTTHKLLAIHAAGHINAYEVGEAAIGAGYVAGLLTGIQLQQARQP